MSKDKAIAIADYEKKKAERRAKAAARRKMYLLEKQEMKADIEAIMVEMEASS